MRSQLADRCPPQQRAQVHRVPVAHVPEKIPSYYGQSPHRELGIPSRASTIGRPFSQSRSSTLRYWTTGVLTPQCGRHPLSSNTPGVS